MEKINIPHAVQENPQGELTPPSVGDVGIGDPTEIYPPELVRTIVAIGSVAIDTNSDIIESEDTAQHRERLSNKNPSRKDKKKVWTTDIEATVEKPIDPETGKGMETPQQFAVKGLRDEMVAMRIAKKVKHRGIHNAEKSLLESGIFEIDPETGESKLRNGQRTEDGKKSLDHLSRGMRSRVKKAEKRYKKLSKHSDH